MELLRRRCLALADESRLKALLLLDQAGELCLCHLQELLGIAASTASRHLHLLQDAGLVKSRRDGKWVHFSLNEHTGGAWLDLLRTDPEARAMAASIAASLASLGCVIAEKETCSC